MPVYCYMPLKRGASMEKRILIAYVQGQPIEDLERLLRRVAEREQTTISFYTPPIMPGAGMSATCWVRLGAKGVAEWPPEQGDVLVALEELEGRRLLYAVRRDAPIILCDTHRLPMAVAAGTVGYPTDTCARMVADKRNVWKVERKEVCPDVLRCLLLRALGYDRKQVEQWPEWENDVTQSLQIAFDKTFSV